MRAFMMFLMIGVFSIQNCNSQTLSDATEIVSHYFNEVYGEGLQPLVPSDLNRRYEIIDVVTQHRVVDELKDGIYFCSLIGDDSCGIYLLVEKSHLTLITIKQVSEFKIAWDYMNRNGFDLAQIQNAINYIIQIDAYETSVTVH